jgi:RND family efflux transporter MFP subunit
VITLVDPSRPGDQFNLSPVISRVGGTVLEAPVNRGDTVTTQTAVLVVGNVANLQVETYVPERFSTKVAVGQNAQVFFEAISDQSFAAEVEEISPVLDPASRTRRIMLKFKEQDKQILAGMFATVSLVTESKSNVPIIPRNAIINTYGSWIVFVVNRNNVAERRELTLGLESEAFIEVLSGVELGEQVVIAGQNFLSNNEPVRVVR